MAIFWFWKALFKSFDFFAQSLGFFDPLFGTKGYFDYQYTTNCEPGNHSSYLSFQSTCTNLVTFVQYFPCSGHSDPYIDMSAMVSIIMKQRS